MGNTQNKEILQGFERWLKLKRGNSDSTIKIGKNIISRFLRWLTENRVRLENISQKTVDDYLLFCSNKYARNSLIPITITL